MLPSTVELALGWAMFGLVVGGLAALVFRDLRKRGKGPATRGLAVALTILALPIGLVFWLAARSSSTQRGSAAPH